MNKKFILLFSFFIIASFVQAESNATKQEAFQSIIDSELIINDLQKNNFSISYFNDTLLEARKAFQQAEYAEILRGEVNSTQEEYILASRAMSIVNWRSVSYDNVLFFTNEIKQRREKAYYLFDAISIEEAKEDYSKDALQILGDAKKAFNEERFQNAENLLEEFKRFTESEKQASIVSLGLKQGTKTFFQRYWRYILVFALFVFAISYYFYKSFQKRWIIQKIKRLKAEEIALEKLMKKTQDERFNKNILSAFVYNIRIKKYEEKLEAIKQELPVLEAVLKDLKKEKNLLKKINDLLQHF